MSRSIVRFLLFIVVFIAVVVLPWWISAVLLIGLTIYFPLYLEVLFFGFLFDALYAAQYIFPYTALTLAAAVLVVVYLAKTRIRR